MHRKPPTRTALIISIVLLISVWLASAIIAITLTVQLLKPENKGLPAAWLLFAVLLPALVLIPRQLGRYFRSLNEIAAHDRTV